MPFVTDIKYNMKLIGICLNDIAIKQLNGIFSVKFNRTFHNILIGITGGTFVIIHVIAKNDYADDWWVNGSSDLQSEWHEFKDETPKNMPKPRFFASYCKGNQLWRHRAGISFIPQTFIYSELESFFHFCEIVKNKLTFIHR